MRGSGIFYGISYDVCMLFASPAVQSDVGRIFFQFVLAQARPGGELCSAYLPVLCAGASRELSK